MIYILTHSKGSIVPLNTPVYISSMYGKNSYNIETNDFVLGVYKDKERALEVLKDLAEQISYGCFVYEMPDE